MNKTADNVKLIKAAVNPKLADYAIGVSPEIGELFNERCSMIKYNSDGNYITVKPFVYLDTSDTIEVSIYIANFLDMSLYGKIDTAVLMSECPIVPDFLNNQNAATRKVISENEEFYKYHSERTAFAQVARSGIVLNHGDVRCHHEWMIEDYGMSEDSYESALRGNIYDGHVQFYVGKEHGPTLEHDKIRQIVRDYKLAYDGHGNQRKIYDGLCVGELGVHWTPMYEVTP